MKIIYLFFLYLLVSCSVISDSAYPIIEVDLNKCKNISIKSLFSAIQLIPLETKAESLIKELSKIEYFENNYFILDEALSRITVFDENGKYKYSIDHSGNGPEEYINISDFIINKKNRTIELLSSVNNTIYIWNVKDGSFREKVILPFLENGAYKSFMLQSPDVWVFWTFDYENRIKYIDNKSHKIVYECFPEQSGDIFSPYEFSNKNKLCRSLNPRVYNFTESGIDIDYEWRIKGLNNELHSKNMDQFQTKKQVLDYAKSIFNSEIVDYVIIRQGESAIYQYMQLIRKNKRFSIFRDKRNENIYVFDKTKENVTINPYYGGDDFIIGTESEDMDINSMMNESLLNEDNKPIWNSKKEDDNPILIKYIY